MVTGACLADAGNDVLCVDIDERKTAMLKRGEVPIHEPGLDVLIERCADAGRLRFTTNAKEGVDHGLFQLIAVGTPPDEDGSADLRYVLAVARTIGELMNNYKVVVTKSTVPVGTADKVRSAVIESLAKRNSKIEFDLASNPEFLKEGAAIADFMKPDRVVVGTDSDRAAELLRSLYEPFTRNHDRMIVMDVRSAELTKYAANAMLATKISFMNELANLAERFGADIESVRVGGGTEVLPNDQVIDCAGLTVMPGFATRTISSIPAWAIMAPRLSASIVSGKDHASLYGRCDNKASKTSATAQMRPARGILAPATPFG